MLGGGTYAAARPAIEALALEYATAAGSTADTEEEAWEEEGACDVPAAAAAAFRGAGGGVATVLYMHDTSPEAVADSMGCSAVLGF